MRSERAIARALAKLIPSELSREELIISTKGGFLPVDAARPVPPAQMFERRFVTTGLCPPDELVQRCHCLAVPFLADQLDKSRENLGLETIDIYFLHNPECQLAEIGRSHFRERLEAAFSFLERAVSEQKIRYYGVATWSGFRASEDSLDYLSLEEMMELAESAGGPEHHFRVIQLPINPAMPEALVRKNQTLPSVDERVSLLEAAARKSLAVLSSASIGQMRFPLGLSDAEDASFGVLNTEAQRALQVVRSLPGVSTALVGMKQPAHIGENLAVPTVPVMSPAEAQRVIAGGA